MDQLYSAASEHTKKVRSPLSLRMIPVLSAFYFGTTEHYRVLAQHPKVIIDLGEHYERQSYRNRTTVIGPKDQ